VGGGRDDDGEHEMRLLQVIHLCCARDERHMACLVNSVLSIQM
jgi:hypothetical protein